MNVPKGLARRDIEEVLKKLLKDDKLNVIIMKEEGTKLIKIKCSRIKSEAIIEFDSENNPTRIMGCSYYDEEIGKCGYNEADCRYTYWEKFKPCEEED